jgi:uncharacterized damage-inducible protein DinB
MLAKTLSILISRDLDKLKTEIELYRDEKKIWYTQGNIANSAGNLCLHLIGNLNTFIGKELGGTNYVRNRDLEFSLKDISKSELVSKVEETKLTVKNTLDNLSDQDLSAEYPVLVLQEKKSTEYFLVHLATHLSYHLGQINYHRRLLDI